MMSTTEVIDHSSMLQAKYILLVQKIHITLMEFIIEKTRWI